VPLYRLRSDSNQDHFYTSNQFEIPEYTDNGYRFESIIGKVFTDKQPNTVPLHRLYCPSEKNHFYTIRDNYDKLVTRSYNPYIYEGIVGYVYETEVDNSIPLYRLRSDAQKNHFYTTNSKEKDNATKKGYRFERVECYILPSEQNNVQSDPGVAVKPPGDEKKLTSPLYRLRSDSNQDHFYTSNQAEIPAFTDQDYRFESIIGEVFTEQQPNTVPLQRLYCPSENNHFYTIRDNYNKLITRSYNPYTYEGVVGYVYPSQIGNSIPLYRLRSDAQKNHFYTTNSKEKDNATKKDYRFERVECYILPAGTEAQAHNIQEKQIPEEPLASVEEDGVFVAGNATSDGTGDKTVEGKGGTAADIPRDIISLNDIIVIEQVDGEIFSFQIEAYYKGGLYTDGNWSSMLFSIKGIKEGENETIEIPIGEKSSLASAIKDDKYYGDFRVRINTYQQSPYYRPKVGKAKISVRKPNTFSDHTSLNNIVLASISYDEKYPRVIYEIKNNDLYYNQGCKIFIAYSSSKQTNQYGVLENYQTTRIGSGIFSEYTVMNKNGRYNIQFDVPDTTGKTYYQIFLIDTAANIPEASTVFTLP
jgi:hypothetical protein